MCCCAIASMPPPDKITPDTPLRLEIAAALAFPDGSMTASGLRREGCPWASRHRAHCRKRLHHARQY